MRVERSQDNHIRVAADRYDVDPALVKAVVWRESRFDPLARGRAGELGLMQLREIAAREWADSEQVIHFRHSHCLDPSTNTLAGAYYLGMLLKRYHHTDNPVPYALADYNAGRSRVLQWVEGPGATNSRLFIEQIGFPSTRDYVSQVMRRSHRYAALR
jgi:soluble lytic murein transglycosylase